MSKYLYRLMEYHRRLDDELRAEMRRTGPSFARIQRLKKLKLSVKDRLHWMMRGGQGPQVA
jgi:uncharacterized protein